VGWTSICNPENKKKHKHRGGTNSQGPLYEAMSPRPLLLKLLQDEGGGQKKKRKTKKLPGGGFW